MINGKELLEAGFRRFEQNTKGEGCECLWQKKVEDGSGLRYYINIYEWRLDKIVPGYVGLSPSFEPRVQFTRADRDTIDIHFHCGRDHSLADIEAFFDEAWSKMGFAHYEKSGWSPAA